MSINNRPTLIIYTQQFANTYIGLVEFQYISGNLLIPETKVCCATLFCTEEWTLVKDRHDCTTKATTIGLILPLNHLRPLLNILLLLRAAFMTWTKISKKLSFKVLRTRLDRTTEHSQLKRRPKGASKRQCFEAKGAFWVVQKKDSVRAFAASPFNRGSRTPRLLFLLYVYVPKFVPLGRFPMENKYNMYNLFYEVRYKISLLC